MPHPVECDEFLVVNFIILVLHKFRTNVLVANHLIIWERTKFDTEHKSSKFLLEIKTLVSLSNNTDSDIEIILRGKSFIYLMNNRGPTTDPWGIHSMLTSQRKNF
jgi:hypothetical protein